LELPEAPPPLSVKLPTAVVGLFPPLLLTCAISETSPVGVPVPEEGATVMLTLTACPCVSVMGLVAGVVESERVVVEGVKLTEVQLFTRFAALTEPNPVAMSKPVVVVQAATGGLPEVSIPYSPDTVLLQCGDPPAQATELFPTVTS
jgi:hypothetical protein